MESIRIIRGTDHPLMCPNELGMAFVDEYILDFSLIFNPVVKKVKLNHNIWQHDIFNFCQMHYKRAQKIQEIMLKAVDKCLTRNIFDTEYHNIPNVIIFEPVAIIRGGEFSKITDQWYELKKPSLLFCDFKPAKYKQDKRIQYFDVLDSTQIRFLNTIPYT